MEIKVGDFGLATKLEFDSEKKMTICGTPNYIAPEILDGHGHSYEVDIWSLGVVLYACLIGKPPFETNNVKTTYSRIRTNSYSFPDHIPLSRQARSLIEVILLSDPGKRPSLDEILQSDFLNTGYEIPKAPPASTIAVPPSEKFLSKYRHNENNILKPSNNQRPLI